MSANPARPKPGAMLARRADIPEDGAKAFEFAVGEARFSLILGSSGGEIFGFENDCPHAHYPLDRPDGRVIVQERAFLVCSAHGASFRIVDGACVGGPCIGRALTRVALRIEGDAVLMRGE